MENKYIKYVAMYLRKSRGDLDKDLEKHKIVLTELCIENNWKYVEYDEIGSSDSITLRPKFQQLLTDIENELFDAVCVVDIDRLGRGDLGDQDRIKKAFAKTNTLVITPQQIYNLNDDNDEFVVDMKSFIARREYKQIVKRLTQGKKIGSKLGMWTNGTPPFPYEYQRYKDKFNEKGLVVNDDKLKAYRFMVDSFLLKKMSTQTIAEELNKNHIPSPRDSFWHSNQVYRILTNETHLGKIISNKTKGNGHKHKNQKVQILPKSEWVVVDNCHEAIKTQEEHDLIILRLRELDSIPRRLKKDNIKPLTGLIKCGLCSHTLTLENREDRKNPERIKACWYVDPYGDKCKNSSITTSVIYEEIYNKTVMYRDEIKKRIENNDVVNQQNKHEDEIINVKLKIKQNEKAAERIVEAYENGVYTLKQYKERKVKNEKELQDLKIKIKGLELANSSHRTPSLESKFEILNDFIDNINSSTLSNQEKNNKFKVILEKIIYTNIDGNVNIKIEFK